MKISEVIALLKRRMEKHGDLEVAITWEGTTHSFRPIDVQLAQDGSLVIDADCDGIIKSGPGYDE